jgi:hypothetical protein
MGWIVKSESDIDKVWVEVDDDLHETGKAFVEHLTEPTPSTQLASVTQLTPTSTSAPTAEPSQYIARLTRRTVALILALGAAGGVAADLTLHFLTHAL